MKKCDCYEGEEVTCSDCGKVRVMVSAISRKELLAAKIFGLMEAMKPLLDEWHKLHIKDAKETK